MPAIFTIKIRWKYVSAIKKISGMIFTIKVYHQLFLLQKFIANEVYYENILPVIFAIKFFYLLLNDITTSRVI